MCMLVVNRVKKTIRHIREKDPAQNDHADDLEQLSYQLQLCAAAVLTLQCSDDRDLDSTLREGQGRRAFDLALSMEAKIFLSQPKVRYTSRAPPSPTASIRLARLFPCSPLR